MEEKKEEKKEGLVEKVAKKVTKKKAVKSEEKSEEKPAPKKSGGSREILEIYPSKNKALVKDGDKKLKVHRLLKRRTKEVFLAVPGGEKVLEEEWLSGKDL